MQADLNTIYQLGILERLSIDVRTDDARKTGQNTMQTKLLVAFSTGCKHIVGLMRQELSIGIALCNVGVHETHQGAAVIFSSTEDSLILGKNVAFR